MGDVVECSRKVEERHRSKAVLHRCGYLPLVLADSMLLGFDAPVITIKVAHQPNAHSSFQQLIQCRQICVVCFLLQWSRANLLTFNSKIKLSEYTIFGIAPWRLYLEALFWCVLKQVKKEHYVIKFYPKVTFGRQILFEWPCQFIRQWPWPSFSKSNLCFCNCSITAAPRSIIVGKRYQVNKQLNAQTSM